MTRTAAAAWGLLVAWVIWAGAAAGISTTVPVPVGVTLIAWFWTIPLLAAWVVGR